ncbi:MAG TPA: hemerythrin domain-containing protein [Anaeromyxobacteraceae bacterium]|nr:hemerythrin domain-containing protein [Anaeromyxobacteraceae bacterium]
MAFAATAAHHGSQAPVPLAPLVASTPGPSRTAGGDRLSDRFLVAHLLEHHHAYARRVLPYVAPLLAKVAGFYGRRYEKLNALCDAGEELAEALEAHLDEEERALFPALLDGTPPREVLRRALERMHRQHLELERLLVRVRSTADGFAAPIWAGRSHEVLLEELEALEENVVEHIHLERYLFVSRLFAPARGIPHSASSHAA